METRKLGYSDLNLTTIGLGTWAMGGGGWKFGCRIGAQKRALITYGCGENGAAFIICVDCFKISPLVIG